ncbi:membrane hypothetical protein [Gammaproteobacteria bacterium]
MPSVTNLFQPYMDVVFLIYGLAFLVMGLVILIRHNQKSNLQLANNLRLLAGFGFIHGFLEWMDLWRVVHGDIAWLATMRPIILLVSYLFLFEFGRRLVYISLSPEALTKSAILLNAWIYAPLLLVILAAVMISHQPMLALNIWSRYLIGFIGSSISGIGFILYYHKHLMLEITETESSTIRLASHFAGTAFLAYGVFGGLVVPLSDWFPSSIINQESFLVTFHIPVQLLRALCAVWITVSVCILLGVFHLEEQQHLRNAFQRMQQTLADLHRLNHQNELILSSAVEGIFGIDTEGRTVFVNKAALHMLGYQQEELIGKSIHALTHHTTLQGDFYPVEDCPIHQTMKTHTIHHINSDVFWRKDGSSFSVEYQSAPIWNEEQMFGAVVAFQDITERKQQQAIEAFMREGAEMNPAGQEQYQSPKGRGPTTKGASRLQSRFPPECAHGPSRPI